MIHSDEKVQAAITQLCDALVTYERNTGIHSILILKDGEGFVLRSVDGRGYNVFEDVSDVHIIDMVVNRMF